MELTADKVVTWRRTDARPGIAWGRLFIGPDPSNVGGMQVAVSTTKTLPSRQALRNLFTSRRRKAQTPVAAVTIGTAAHLFLPNPQALQIGMLTKIAQRQPHSVLAEPQAIASTGRLAGFRKVQDTAAKAFANDESLPVPRMAVPGNGGLS